MPGFPTKIAGCALLPRVASAYRSLALVCIVGLVCVTAIIIVVWAVLVWGTLFGGLGEHAQVHFVRRAVTAGGSHVGAQRALEGLLCSHCGLAGI